MRLSEAIKHLAVGAVDAESPVELLPAEVVSVSPVEIKLKENSKLIIPEDAIIIPKRMQSGGDDALGAGGSPHDRGSDWRAIVFYFR